jgi:hypothetical protein
MLVVSFILRQLCSQGNKCIFPLHQCLLDKTLGELKAGLGVAAKRNIAAQQFFFFLACAK